MKNEKRKMNMPFTASEKQALKKNGVKIRDIQNFAVDELEVLLDTSPERAREVLALAEFQTVPSVGISFSEDLVFLGYYSIGELKGKDGARLVEDYERKKGSWIDPCVEDQFRLIVHYANTGDRSKKWWDFTAERKQYRLENGYPADRPKMVWHEGRGMESTRKPKE